MQLCRATPHRTLRSRRPTRPTTTDCTTRRMVPRRLLSPGLRRHLTDCGQVELTALSSNHLHVVALRSDHFVQRFDDSQTSSSVPSRRSSASSAITRAVRRAGYYSAAPPFSCRSWLGRAHRPGRGRPLANGGWAWLEATLDRHPPGRHGQHQVVEPRRERVTPRNARPRGIRHHQRRFDLSAAEPSSPVACASSTA